MGAANRAGSDIPTPPLSTKSAGRHELHAAAPGSEDLLLLYHFLLEGIVTWLMEMAILKAPFDLLTIGILLPGLSVADREGEDGGWLL